MLITNLYRSYGDSNFNSKNNKIKKKKQEKITSSLGELKIKTSNRLKSGEKKRVTSHDLIGLVGEAQAMRTRQWKPTRKLGAASLLHYSQNAERKNQRNLGLKSTLKGNVLCYKISICLLLSSIISAPVLADATTPAADSTTETYKTTGLDRASKL